jgi:hypothetical protein
VISQQQQQQQQQFLATCSLIYIDRHLLYLRRHVPPASPFLFSSSVWRLQPWQQHEQQQHLQESLGGG